MPVGRREAFSIQLLQLLDAALVAAAFVIADFLRGPVRALLDQPQIEGGHLGDMLWVLYVAVPFTPLMLEFIGFYRRPRSKTAWLACSQLLRGLIGIALFIGLLSIFARLPDASRLILGMGAILIFFILLGRERVYRRYLLQRTVRDDLKERVVIAGTTEEIDGFLAEIEPEIRAALKVVGRFDLNESGSGELYELVKRESVERVIFAAGDSGFAKVAACVEVCELQGVEAWIAASFMRTQVARPTFDLMGSKPMLVLRSTPDVSWELALKAVFDRVGATLILLVSAPIWMIAWVGVRVCSPGAPAFYSQKRAGRYGRPFKMWKFRTMVPDADKLLDQIKCDHGNQMDGPVFKLDNDPRIFRFGAWLRKLSIDELPQLLNVVRGEMSLVGPRPLPLYEVEAFEKSEHRRRLSVKPGITCEWQAGGRNKITSFEQWVEMDLEYIDNWSFWLDIKLLLKTIPAVIFGRGAK